MWFEDGEWGSDTGLGGSGVTDYSLFSTMKAETRRLAGAPQ
jgi:hypothetical protein